MSDEETEMSFAPPRHPPRVTPISQRVPAPPGRRAAAAVIEGLMSLLATGSAAVVIQLGMVDDTIWMVGLGVAMLLAWLVAVIVVGLRFAGTGVSPGKKMMGLRLVHVETGAAPGVGAAWGRYLLVGLGFSLVVGLVVAVVQVLGGGTRDRRTWYDSMTNVMLVDDRGSASGFDPRAGASWVAPAGPVFGSVAQPGVPQVAGANPFDRFDEELPAPWVGGSDRPDQSVLQPARAPQPMAHVPTEVVAPAEGQSADQKYQATTGEWTPPGPDAPPAAAPPALPEPPAPASLAAEWLWNAPQWPQQTQSALDWQQAQEGAAAAAAPEPVVPAASAASEPVVPIAPAASAAVLPTDLPAVSAPAGPPLAPSPAEPVGHPSQAAVVSRFGPPPSATPAQAAAFGGVRAVRSAPAPEQPAPAQVLPAPEPPASAQALPVRVPPPAQTAPVPAAPGPRALPPVPPPPPSAQVLAPPQPAPPQPAPSPQLVVEDPTVALPAHQLLMALSETAAQQPVVHEVAAPRGPAVAVLTFESGAVEEVSGSGVIGRNPQSPGDPAATLIRIADTTRTVSKSHLAFVVEELGIVVTDLASTNGSTLIGLDGVRTRLEPEVPVFVAFGSTLTVGEHGLMVTRVGEVPDDGFVDVTVLRARG